MIYSYLHQKNVLGGLFIIMFVCSTYAQAVVTDTGISGGPPNTEIVIFGPDNEDKPITKNDDNDGPLIFSGGEGTRTKTNSDGHFIFACIPGIRYTVGSAGGTEQDSFLCRPDGKICLADLNRITSPIDRVMPAGQDIASRTVSGLGDMAKGMMFGGGGGMGGMLGGGGSRALPKPKGKWTKIGNDSNSIELNGWIYKPRSKKKQPRIRIAQRVSDSDDDGTPDTMLLQNIDGRILTPVSYMIFENWIHWKLTISVWRETYRNGQLISSKKISEESTSWDEMKDRYAVLIEAPSIWERLGADPFGKLRGVIAEYPLPENFKPEEWSLVSHVTSRAEENGKEIIKTLPYIVNLAQGPKKKFSFQESPNGKTRYQIARECP